MPAATLQPLTPSRLTGCIQRIQNMQFARQKAGSVSLTARQLMPSFRPFHCYREEMVEEQRRREAEEAANLRAAQDMSRLSLGSQASGSNVPPPPPPHYPPPAYSVSV
jgi:hypothetical protein